MTKILYTAIGLLLAVIAALFLFIRGNAFIIPEPNQIPTPTSIIIQIPNKASPSAIISNDWACPSTSTINCMLGPGFDNAKQCENEYVQWALQNCPGFQGAEY